MADIEHVEIKGTTYDIPVGGDVSSVNGQTGDVVLDADDVGALPDSTAIPTKTSDLTNDSGFIISSSVPTKVSDLTNDAGYITGYTETDPTVPSWAKQSSKPSYTAQEVGALPSSTAIPSKTSDLNNDSGFITASQVPTYTATSPIDITNDVVSHDASGVTAGTYDGGAVKGTGFYVPSITVDAEGHITSATDLGNLIPVNNISNANEAPGTLITPYSWSMGIREATSNIFGTSFVLSAGNTTKTITISSDSESAYSFTSHFHVIDVAFYDYSTKERLICDWTTNVNNAIGSGLTITVTIASAHTNHILIKPIISYASAM